MVSRRVREVIFVWNNGMNVTKSCLLSCSTICTFPLSIIALNKQPTCFSIKVIILKQPFTNTGEGCVYIGGESGGEDGDD